MKNFYTKSKYIISLLIITICIAPLSLFAQEEPLKAIPVDPTTFQPITTQQQGGSTSAGAAGAATSIGSCIGASGLVGVVTNLISSFVGGILGFGSVPINDAVQQGKESGILGAISWDQIGWCLANSAIEQIGAATVSWINGGFQGNPVFVDDPAQFFTNIADAEAGAFFAELGGGFLCEPLQNIVRVNLATTYNSNISQYSDNAQCSFSSVAGNFEQFTSGQAFSWDDWFSYTQVPQNNEMGATIFGQIELDKRITSMLGLEKNKLDWSGGFFSIKDKETGKITTPGKVVEDQINQKLFSGQRRLEVADEFNEVVNALVNQLINTAISGLMQPSTSGGSYGGVPTGGTGDLQSQSQTYIVSFNENGGIGTTPDQAFKEGEPQAIRSNQFIRSNYNFVGWNTSAAGTGIAYDNGAEFTIGSENITLYAQWTEKPVFSLSIEKIGRGNVRSQPSGVRCGNNCTGSFAEDTQVTLTATGQDGYTFVGWRGNGCANETALSCTINMNQARSITATFTQNTINVLFDGNGSTTGMPIQVFNEGQTQNLSANQFTRLGYQFAGWSTTRNGPVVYQNRDSFTMGNTSVTLYALWVPARYSINFAPNGANSGSMSSITDITPGEGATLPRSTYARSGYTFAGWATSAEGTVVYTDEQQIPSVPGNLTLYAKWTANSYTLSFDANGGSGTMNPITFTRGQNITLPTNTFTRTGYTFEGWAVSQGGSVEYDIGASYSNAPSSDVVLYAVWGAN